MLHLNQLVLKSLQDQQLSLDFQSESDLIINAVLYKICQIGSRREGAEEIIDLVYNVRLNQFNHGHEGTDVEFGVLDINGVAMQSAMRELEQALIPESAINYQTLASQIKVVMMTALTSINKLYGMRRIDVVSLMTYLTGQKGRLRESLSSSMVNRLNQTAVIQFKKENETGVNRSYRALRRLKGLISA